THANMRTTSRPRREGSMKSGLWHVRPRITWSRVIRWPTVHAWPENSCRPDEGTSAHTLGLQARDGRSAWQSLVERRATLWGKSPVDSRATRFTEVPLRLPWTEDAVRMRKTSVPESKDPRGRVTLPAWRDSTKG